MNIQMVIGLMAAILVSPSSSFAQSKGIYGGDDRVDFFAAPRGMQALSDSVVSLWKADSVEMSGAGGVKLHTMNFGEQFNLCPGERFREQPIGSFCSGALVGEDLVITAGHCIRNREDCANTRIVFGYAVKKAGQAAATRLPAGEVYGCARILRRSSGVGRGYSSGEVIGPDFAVIRLDRKVAGHKPLAVNRGAEIGKGAPLFVIGHPVGLPLKVAGGASVREFAAGGYFIADLDAFGGNSGSPVFNAKTGLIEGVIARGDRDFVTSPAGCTATAYAQSGGGEAVTKVAMFSDFIQAVDVPDAGSAAVKAVNMDSGSIQPGTEAALPVTLSFD